MIKVNRTRRMLLSLLTAFAVCGLASAADVVGPEKGATPGEGVALPSAIPTVTAPASLDPVHDIDLAQPAASASALEGFSAVAPQTGVSAAEGPKAVAPEGGVRSEGAPGAAHQAAAEVQGAAAAVSAHAGDEKGAESWLFDKQQGHGQTPDAGVMGEAQLAAYLAMPEHTPAKKLASSAKMAVFDSGDYRPQYEPYLRKHGYELIRVLNPTRAEVDRFGEDQGFILKSEWIRWLAPAKPVDDYVAAMEGSDARRNFRRRLDGSKGVSGEFVPLTKDNLALFDLWYDEAYVKQFEEGGDRVRHLSKDWAREQLANPKAPKWQIILFRDPTDHNRVLGGALAAPVPGANRLSLGYAAYDESEYARKFQLSVRTFAEGLKLATAQNLKYISYGADRSRFDRKAFTAEGKDDGTGFDFAAMGLLEYKSGVRMTAGPEEGVMLEKDLVSEGRGHEFFVLGLKRQGPHMDAYYAARDRGEKPEIDTLTGPLLEPGSMTPHQIMQGHHFSKGGSKVRAPREIDVTEHAFK